MITVTRTTRKTGEVMSAAFSTERGAYEHVRALLHDNTNVPLRLCEDVAGMLCDPYYRVRLTRYGPFLFTIVRSTGDVAPPAPPIQEEFQQSILNWV